MEHAKVTAGEFPDRILELSYYETFIRGVISWIVVQAYFAA